ncbi:MAG: DUF4388 domain-containing protein [Deltaproteobacteria bacterium]|nr:DUF4388 domain-containing protein [Deltaproteobacteria bacterium]
MALRGTLGDFSVADIFQLVGHQGKTGILRIRNRQTETAVYFVDGSVVRAEETARVDADLLGNMMVRAEVFTEPELKAALETQKLTQRRLGDILVESGATDQGTLREFTALQTTETIYRLFEWDAGDYEFAPEDAIEYDPQTHFPIRAENLLMEAFRIVDEWPAVRKTIPNYGVVFNPLRLLPQESASVQATDDDDDDDLMAGYDAQMGGDDDVEETKTEESVGKNERLVYVLVAPERTAQEIIDRSRLGAFETCKALSSLVKKGFINATLPVEQAVRVRSKPKEMLAKVVPLLIRIGLYAAVALSVGLTVKLMDMDENSIFSSKQNRLVRPVTIQSQVALISRSRIEDAIEMFRLLNGAYPASLDELTEAGLIHERQVAFPFERRFLYERTAERYRLYTPIR